MSYQGSMKKSGWKDCILSGDCREMLQTLPDKCAHLAITSPPYNVGLDYDSHNDRMSCEEYLAWLLPMWHQVHRVLVDGGRFALNIASTSIKDFKPIHYDMAAQLRALGFIMRTEIIWHEQTMRAPYRVGSWKSPRNPHIIPSWEYVLVFSKGTWTLEGNKQDVDIAGEEFIKFSDGLWQITLETRGRQPFLYNLYPPKSGRKRPETNAGSHPAPFPEELIYWLMKSYSFRGNVVLDSFGGTGTVAVAKKTSRHFIHVDVSKKYCQIAAERLAQVTHGSIA